MPSVCKNSEKLSNSEMETPYKACISAIEKKLRNLEKRKGKLDAYREKLTKGEKLDKDQKEAVAKYETVVASLEFAKELQKQFQMMSDEADKLAEKQAKKQLKREKIERQQQEIERLSEILRLQCLLDNLGTDEVRADLQSGKYSSLTVTEQNLTQLDEFYQLIAPSTDNTETSFSAQLVSSSEHLMSYLDRSDKAVVNTTYKELHELVDRAAQSGFFDAGSSAQPGAGTSGSATETAEAEKADAEQEETGDEVTAGGAAEAEEEEEEQTTETAETLESQPVETEAPAIDSSLSMLSKSEVVESQFEMVSVPESIVSAAGGLPTASLAGMTWYQQSAPPVVPPAAAINQARQQRPLQEIVSSLQGNYNFLQDSEIDAESSFDRMNYAASQDPAAFAAAYMSQQVVAPQGVDLHHFPAAAAAPPTTYPNGSYVAPHHHQVALQQEPSYVVVGHDPTSGELQYAYAATQSGYMPPGVLTMSSATADMTTMQHVQQQQQNVLAQQKAMTQTAETAKVGAGDSTDNMVSVAVQQQQQQQSGMAQPQAHSNVPEQLQGFEGSAGHGYGGGAGGAYGGRGGRGNSYGAGYSGAARAPSRGGPYGGTMSAGAGGRGGNTGYRGGKPR